MTERMFHVVVNAEEQHSLWPVGRDLPAGWSAVSGPDTESECLAYIEAVWTDITPRSVRDRLAEQRGRR
ncbi:MULTISPECIES: MbtH family protein [unclassified Streptomyces]|uniref:MbtH family protein n=1 Tax=unclassified Streptomyces TaxID=2593676 RepID=UPI001BEA5081|nr:MULTISPECIES: MbtH family protein [unclassified Streptomyces]MBT2408588.1 MbtH family protein [Streptomyces sp. ISL-21]MBT2458181.1 MbtH family protein [Streptomyces sp. ISL-86]MBT2608728.1 MbtH family protein [Streptomyces sp. ISL-87]